jgi:tRNA U34 5-methylaminomethyl-2-thiouridine-forming methyltransferase MnmC
MSGIGSSYRHERLDLLWLEDGSPYSTRYADGFFSRAGGREESRHVFVSGNDLIGRWRGLRECLIAELGFGAGLNFLEAMSQWRNAGAVGGKLRYVAFERYPLPSGQMARTLSLWPDLLATAEPVLARWPGHAKLFRVELGTDIELSVWMGDANHSLPEAAFAADAWYLDGFAPSRNPDIWSEELIGEVYDHTRPGGTFATYTAAGWVRRNLERAGFVVQRQRGFAGKREMMRGFRPGAE